MITVRMAGAAFRVSRMNIKTEMVKTSCLIVQRLDWNTCCMYIIQWPGQRLTDAECSSTAPRPIDVQFHWP